MRANGIIILVIAILLGMSNAKAQEDYSKAQKAPQAKEVVLTREAQTKKGYNSPQAAYKAALREAKQVYTNKEVGIRNLTKGNVSVNGDGSVSYYYTYTVVELPGVVAQKMYEAIGKATRQIDEGTRFAIDKVSIAEGIADKEKTNGQIVDYLISKGYKVLAKEKLQKLYKEQQDQRSGIYNEETVSEMGNFSAVGYFISVRITGEYVQVQVINVSTGEYVGNVTENL
jgi:PBP1b-binding outer membrane lipoprotein LpoB